MGAWSRTTKRVRHDLEKVLKEVSKYDGARQSAINRVKELDEQKRELTEQLSALRQELVEIEFSEFFLPAGDLSGFLNIVLEPMSDPKFEEIVQHRVEKAISFLKERAVHKTDIVESVRSDDEAEVVVSDGEYGEIICELYDPKNPEFKNSRVHRLRLIPVSMDGLKGEE